MTGFTVLLVIFSFVLVNIWARFGFEHGLGLSKKIPFFSRTADFIKTRIRFINFAFLFVLVVFCSYILLSPPQIIQTLPTNGSLVSDSQKSIEIVFDHWVRPDQLKISLIPQVAGEWREEKSIFGTWLSKKIIFVPQETFKLDVLYRAEISGIQGILGLRGQPYVFSFRTLSAPKVVAVSPENNKEDVVLDTDIEILLDHDGGQAVEWEFVFSPEIDLTVSKMTDKPGFFIRSQQELDQETRYSFTIFQIPVVYNLAEKTVVSRGEKVAVYEGSFSTILAPQVLTFSPKGVNILPNEPLKISFSKEMDRNSVETKLQIIPSVSGSFTWEEGKTVVFRPEAWAKATHYQVAVPQGVVDTQGGYFSEEALFDFTVIGRVEAVDFFPASQVTNVEVDTFVSVKFNQSVDHESAQAKFKLVPEVKGRFLWKDNVMSFVPEQNLVYDRQYQVLIDSGVKSIHGLDSSRQFSSTFTTRKYQVLLSVPLIHQQHSHTCNIAATRMALAFRKIWLTEEQILQKIGFDATPYDPEKGIWGDPNKHFIGSIDGKPKGYGVHWDPIARVVGEYREAKVYRNWNLAGLLGEVEKGNPVILWWQNGWNDPTPISWHTPDGEYIQGVEGMHSELVRGFIGDKENPEEIIVNDPWRGVQHYDKDKFLSIWGYYDNTGLVVY